MEDKTMKKKTYIQPEIENVIAMELMQMQEKSWGVDGQHQPIDEAGGDEIDVLGKEGSNMWDGWDE
jgi:hypothetical protein